MASPMPGTGGGKCRSSIWVASAAWSVSALNSADSRTLLRTGTCPPLAHSRLFWLIQLMKTRAASCLFWSGVRMRRQHELV